MINQSIEPYILNLGKTGSSSLGYITIVEDIAFSFKRAYWTYYAPHEVVRGHHAHKNLYQLIVALSGTISFQLEDLNKRKSNFTLDDPSKALFIPPGHWRTIQFSHNAVLLCLASDYYSEDDYIRTYDEFIKLQNDR